MVLIPLIRENTGLPLIAAGGIAGGRSMLAAMVLGAEGVQIGSLFAASEESSAHPAFKNRIVATGDGDTLLTMKKVIPVRLIKNSFFERVHQMESQGATTEEIKSFLGRGRAKKGMFEGDLEEGELEIGQVAALIREIKPAASILKEIIEEYRQAIQEHCIQQQF